MVTWISSTRLAARWLNRVQNQSVLCVCEATTGACSEVNQSLWLESSCLCAGEPDWFLSAAWIHIKGGRLREECLVVRAAAVSAGSNY